MSYTAYAFAADLKANNVNAQVVDGVAVLIIHNGVEAHAWFDDNGHWMTFVQGRDGRLYTLPEVLKALGLPSGVIPA